MKPVLLDLCCGTGTIGMVLAKHVDRVVGVEIVEDAIKDAVVNARNNNIENITFECAPVEKVIDKVINSIPKDQSIVVVLDPPRSGVHPDVIRAIRRCERIKRVVYVACNAHAAAEANFGHFTRPSSKSLVGSMLGITRSQPVDLFPHTEHCELVVQFSRP